MNVAKIIWIVKKTDFLSQCQTDTKSLFGYRLLLKIKNWKHRSKIIFKGVNSIVRHNFKVRFIFFHIYRSCIQYTRSTEKKMQGNTQMRYPNSHYGVSAPPPWWSLVRKSVKWDDIKRKKCNSFFFFFNFLFFFYLSLLWP